MWIYEAYAYYKQLGRRARNSGGGLEIEMMHLKRARAIYNLVGMNEEFQQMDTFISMYTDTPNKQAANDGYVLSYHLH